MWQLPHRRLDDAACAPATEAHDASKHVFAAASPGEHGDHCAICHWTRWFKPGLGDGPHSVVPDGSSAELAGYAAPFRRDHSANRLSSRAPPADLLT